MMPIMTTNIVRLTALEAHLVPLVATGHLLLGRVHVPVALGALGRLRSLERHPEVDDEKRGGKFKMA